MFNSTYCCNQVQIKIGVQLQLHVDLIHTDSLHVQAHAERKGHKKAAPHHMDHDHLVLISATWHCRHMPSAMHMHSWAIPHGMACTNIGANTTNIGGCPTWDVPTHVGHHH